jgi:hypothetical protein
VMNCWAWATWADRWQHFEKAPEKLIKAWDKEKIKRFNLDGAIDFWWQVKSNYFGKMDTWAIFWYASIFEQNGLCLNPTRPLVENIGHDGSGVNCGVNNLYVKNKLQTHVAKFPMVISESVLAIQKTKEYFKSTTPSLPKRFAKIIKRVIKK